MRCTSGVLGLDELLQKVVEEEDRDKRVLMTQMIALALKKEVIQKEKEVIQMEKEVIQWEKEKGSDPDGEGSDPEGDGERSAQEEPVEQWTFEPEGRAHRSISARALRTQDQNRNRRRVIEAINQAGIRQR